MEPHFAVVHFPVALLVAGGGWLVVSIVTGRPTRGKDIAVGMLGTGALFSVLAVITGLVMAGDHEGHHAGAVDTHRVLGVATMVTGLLALASHWMRGRVANADLIRDLLFIAAAVLAGSTGAVGGDMSHGEPHDSSTVHAHAPPSSVGEAPSPLLPPTDDSDHHSGHDDHDH